MKKILGILGVLGLLGSLGLNIFQYSQNQKLAKSNKVTNVVDGDTIIIGGWQRIRLSNIEAPEINLCGGPEAKQYLEKLILGKNVEIVANTEDVFNRTLALVYLKDVLVNEVLLREGLVRYDGTPNPQRERLKKADDEAVVNKRGIHGPPCFAEKPDDPKCLIKGNITKNTAIKHYFFPGCSEYSAVFVEKNLGESWFCTEAEAEKAGFVKAQNCFGKVYKN